MLQVGGKGASMWGNKTVKEVTELNNELFLVAKEVMEEHTYSNHIGWYSVGEFIDYLEENYTITKKEKQV